MPGRLISAVRRCLAVAAGRGAAGAAGMSGIFVA
jgi:hypothetical protein